MKQAWIFLFFAGFDNYVALEANVEGTPMFYALDNPCMEKYRLCPTVCDVITLKHDVQCQFCFCKNPDNNIDIDQDQVQSVVWETSTMQSATKQHIQGIINAEKANLQWGGNVLTTKSPYLIVNNIKYVTLQNPCVPTLAMCPVRCLMSNVTYNGRICENCFCSKAIKDSFTDSFGRRLVPLTDIFTNAIRDRSIPVALKKDHDKEKRLVFTHCRFLFCPIHHCPNGEKFDTDENGCPLCSCVKQTYTTTSTMLKTAKHEHSQESSRPDTTDFFCMSNSGHCPRDCRQHNITVDNWHCHFCRCPPGLTFVAMVNPCRGREQLCPTHCAVRNTTTSVILGSLSCDYCDCRSNYQSANLGTSRMSMNTIHRTGGIGFHTKFHCLRQADDCPSSCQLINIHKYQRSCMICSCRRGLFIK